MGIKRSLSRLGKQQHQTPHQRVWLAIKNQASDFTVESIAVIGEMKIRSVQCFVRSLLQAEIIAETYVEGNGKKGKQHYQLIRDVGYQAPLLSRSTEVIQQAMWNTLRITKSSISPFELSRLSSNDEVLVTEYAATGFLEDLYLAGYVKADLSQRYSSFKRTKFQLLPRMNTGPKPPKIQRAKQIFDQNLNKVMFVETPMIEEEWKHGTKLEKCYV